jgi:hypothetical protein
MNINDLTLGQIKEIQALAFNTQQSQNEGINFSIGKNVIIRTYSAGVWCGTLSQKSGNEVILTNARRLWRWWAAESISLSGVANYGIIESKSQIAPAVDGVWLEAIEIIPTTDKAEKSIMGAKDAKAG